MRNSGASAGMETGSTTAPLWSASSSSTKTSRPSTIGVLAEYCPGTRRQTRTLSTSWPSLRGALAALARFAFVVEQVAAAVVGVQGDEELAAGVGDAPAAGRPAEP